MEAGLIGKGRRVHGLADVPSFFFGLSRSNPSSDLMNSSKSKVKLRHSVEYNGESTSVIMCLN